MELSNVLSFGVVALLLVISPGPNGLLLARTVPVSGKAAGFANVAGFVVGFYLHGALSILGLSAILLQSAQAFLVVKLLGAAYLCWIGIKALRSAIQGPTVSDMPRHQKPSPRSLAGAFAEGLATNALNPKVSMFYLAAFPQFIEPGQNAVLFAFALVSLHAVFNATWFCGMVIAFGRLSSAAKNVRLQRWVQGITGFVFLGFGVRLASLRA